jgi:hypothetical protein
MPAVGSAWQGDVCVLKSKSRLEAPAESINETTMVIAFTVSALRVNGLQHYILATTRTGVPRQLR